MLKLLELKKELSDVDSGIAELRQLIGDCTDEDLEDAYQTKLDHLDLSVRERILDDIRDWYSHVK